MKSKIAIVLMCLALAASQAWCVCVYGHPISLLGCCGFVAFAWLIWVEC